MQNISRKKQIIIVLLFALLIIIIVIASIIGVTKSQNKNQFGGYIKIQNYDQKIKNLSPDMKDAIQTSLYNIVKKNSADTFDPYTVKDAVIRDTSDSQDLDPATHVYNGRFIVDMASIKQSYQTQYAYSTVNTIDVGGSPVVLSCLDEKDLKYGAFTCKDAFAEQSTSNDAILQYLPYQNFSFKITPDKTAVDGHLVLVVALTIPQSDLIGDTASRTQIVALYKNEVTKWITAKGLDPSKYEYSYNYSDDGTLIKSLN